MTADVKQDSHSAQAGTTGGPSLLSEVAGVFTSRMSMLVTMFVTGVLINRFLGAEGKGIFAGLMVYPELMLTILGGGVWQAAAYQLGRGEHSHSDIVASVTGYMASFGFLCVGICASIYALLDNPDFTFWLVVGALAIVPAKLIATYTGGILLGLKDIPGYSRTLWLMPAVRLVGIALLVAIAGYQVGGAIVATFIASGVTGVVGLVAMYRRVPLRLRTTRVIASQQITLGSVYAISLFIRTLNYRADIVVLERLVEPGLLGQYSLGVSLAELLWQLPAALGMVVFSRSAYAKGSPDFTYQIAKLLRVSLFVAVIGSAALAAVAGLTVPFVYGKDFIPSVSVIRWLLPGVVAFVVLKVCSMDLAGRGRPGVALWVIGPTVVLNVVLNLWWVPRYEIIGAAAASTLCYILGAVVYLIVYSRIVEMPLRQLLRPSTSDFAFLSRLPKLVRS